MDFVLKQRLVGAVVLVALGVIFIPMLLEGPDDTLVPELDELPELVDPAPSRPLDAFPTMDTLPESPDTSVLAADAAPDSEPRPEPEPLPEPEAAPESEGAPEPEAEPEVQAAPGAAQSRAQPSPAAEPAAPEPPPAPQEPAAEMPMADAGVNPLLAEWDTPYGIPPFDSIEDARQHAERGDPGRLVELLPGGRRRAGRSRARRRLRKV